MRQSLAHFLLLRLLPVAAIVVLLEPQLLAFAGPGAAKTMATSILLGWSFAGISAAIVAGGRFFLIRRSARRRIPWIVATMVFHPIWWLSASHGDCGYVLRYASVVATLWIALAVALAICWPRPVEAEPKKWKWSLSGALAGVLAGLPLAAILLDRTGVTPGSNTALASSTLGSAAIAGSLVGGGLFRRRTHAVKQFSFSLRTLLLLPIVLAPPIVALLPVLPYQMPYSMIAPSAPFSFVVVDDATGRPIRDAAVQLIDPRFASDDGENQGQRVVTDAAGSAPYYLGASVYGREGLLARTATVTYNPWLIRVAAPGYQPFFTSLSSDVPIPLDRLTARPLGLTFPAPPSVTIRLTPSAIPEQQNRKLR